jgi:hypothetical protein
MNRALTVIALFVASGCITLVPRTETLVEISADQAVSNDAARVHVTVLGGVSGETLIMQAEQDLGGDTEISWPITVALAPTGSDAARTFEVEAVVTDSSGTTIGVARARSGYIAGRTLSLRLTLEECCRAIAGACAADETCQSCACVTADVPVASLSDWSPDAGPAPTTDGDIPSPDADTSDAGMPDAAPDATDDTDDDAGPPPCTPMGTEGHCYVLVSDMDTAVGAEASCATMGGHLMTVSSASEQAVAWTVSMPSGMPTWLGATDEGAEGDWRWNTGESWEPRWGPAQPDNAAGMENCAVLWPDFDGGWADVSCDSMFPFVCELPGPA